MKDSMTFVCTTGAPPQEIITMHVTSTSLSDVLESFERFLRGSGFVFDGVITIVKDIEIGGINDGRG